LSSGGLNRRGCGSRSDIGRATLTATASFCVGREQAEAKDGKRGGENELGHDILLLNGAAVGVPDKELAVTNGVNSQ
jgi:hypothetical protein